ncbi:MAG: hypothetical protein ABI443_03920, partial [Chthoniobacterales bacterium]
EKERYLFYRGAANLEAPLRVVREDKDLVIQTNEPPSPKTPQKAWLADLKPNGIAAFREVTLNPSETNVLARTSGIFEESEYTIENEKALRSRLYEALVADGLFPKEATAMLKTWELSYFQSPGVRLFYLVPREWTEKHLPMYVSVDAEITRVMIGRIEIVTPYQKNLLSILANYPTPFDPRKPPAEYYRLGRFANALILDQMQNQSPGKLAEFAKVFPFVKMGRNQ